MANNYIIYPYGDKDAPLWHNTGITIINQEPVSAGEIATAFSSDDWTDIDGSGSDFTNFGINEDDSISTSYWVVLKYSFTNYTTTGFTNARAINDAVKAAVTAGSHDNVKDLHTDGSFVTYEGISVEFIHVSYNWAAVDTSGYQYSDDDLAILEDNSWGGSNILQGVSWSALLPSTDDGSKKTLLDNVTGNEEEYISAMLKYLDNNTIRGMYTTLINNETIT